MNNLALKIFIFIKIIYHKCFSLPTECTRLVIDFNDKYDAITDIPFQKVASYDDIPSNERNRSNISTKEFHQSRNILVNTISHFGHVGFKLETLILPDKEGEFPFYRVQKEKKDFHLIDDELYEDYRYHTLDVYDDKLVSIELLNALWLSLWSFPDWSVIIKTPTSYIYLEIDRIYLYMNTEFHSNPQGDTLNQNLYLISQSGITVEMILKKIKREREKN